MSQSDPLPDVPDTSYQQYQSQQFQDTWGPLIASIPSRFAAAASSAAQGAGQMVGSDVASATQDVSQATDPLRAYAIQKAQQYGLDPNIFVRQIDQESGFDPNAHNPSGATGIAQFMPDTAKSLGIDPTNPYQSLDGAARWMGQLVGKYGGDYAKALAAYNAGPGAVDQYGGVPPFKETQAYVSNILGNAESAAASVGQQAGNSLGALAPRGGENFSDYSARLISSLGQQSLSSPSAGFGSGGGVTPSPPSLLPQKGESFESYSARLMGALSGNGTKLESTGDDPGSQALGSALDRIGTPYKWGGSDPNGFDCSGLTQYAYQQAGVKLPRTAQQQYDATNRVGIDQLQPGDLVFFGGTDPNDPSAVSHVGIYRGNGQFVDAPDQGETVRVDSLSSPYWAQHFIGGGRVGNPQSSGANPQISSLNPQSSGLRTSDEFRQSGPQALGVQASGDDSGSNAVNLDEPRGPEAAGIVARESDLGPNAPNLNAPPATPAPTSAPLPKPGQPFEEYASSLLGNLAGAARGVGLPIPSGPSTSSTSDQASQGLDATSNLLKVPALGATALPFSPTMPGGSLTGGPSDYGASLPQSDQQSAGVSAVDGLLKLPSSTASGPAQVTVPSAADYERARQVARQAGVYLPPLPGQASDFATELGNMLDAEKNRTRPSLGPEGLGLWNPNEVPDTGLGYNPPDEAASVGNEVTDKLLSGLPSGVVDIGKAGAEKFLGDVGNTLHSAVSGIGSALGLGPAPSVAGASDVLHAVNEWIAPARNTEPAAQQALADFAGRELQATVDAHTLGLQVRTALGPADNAQAANLFDQSGQFVPNPTPVQQALATQVQQLLAGPGQSSTLADVVGTSSTPGAPLSAALQTYLRKIASDEATTQLVQDLQAASPSSAMNYRPGDPLPDGWVPGAAINPRFAPKPVSIIDANGNPLTVYTPGTAFAPDVARAVKNVLAPSPLQGTALGRTYANVTSAAKEGLFALSGFHLLTELRQSYRANGLAGFPVIGKAIQAAVNPGAYNAFRLANADAFSEAARAGVTGLADTTAPDVGAVASGALGALARGVPSGLAAGAATYAGEKASGANDQTARDRALLLGGVTAVAGATVAQPLSEALWSRAVPTLKVLTYQIARQSGADAGDAAAFTNNTLGGQNLVAIARSKTFQDIARQFVLAPDWWESWANQLGGAARGGSLGAMSRSYWLRTAAESAFLLGGLNYAMAGHTADQNAPGHQFDLDVTRLYDANDWAHTGPVYLDVLGPIKSILEAPSDAGKFARGRAGLPVTLGAQALENVNGRGRPIVSKGASLPAALADQVGNALGQVAPVGATQIDQASQTGTPWPVAAFSAITGMRTSQVSKTPITLPSYGDQVQQALDAAGITTKPSVVPDHVGKIPLLPEERNQYQSYANQYRSQALGQLVASPQWARLMPAQQKAAVTRATKLADERAAAEVVRRIPRDEVLRRISAKSPTTQGAGSYVPPASLSYQPPASTRR